MVTKTKCFEALFRLRWPDGFICTNRGHDRSGHLNTRKLRQCYRCHRQTSIIAGTHVISDSLKCFDAVTQAGCGHQAVISGGSRAVVDKPEFHWVNTVLGNLKTVS